MAYASISGLSDRFGEAMLIDLSDRAAVPTGAIVPAVIEAALADTDALIDGYLARRYTLPLSAVPALIVTLAETICIYKLHTLVAPEKIDKDHTAALKLLADIAKGDVAIPADGLPPAGNNSEGVRTQDRARAMTPENMTGLI
ncbi:MAG: DUF1320 domain-containing protein [Paracoccaceae bacterium]